MNEFVYTPADVEKHFRMTPDFLRDNRLKGHLEHYGKQGENGRWTYSRLDMIAFWCFTVQKGGLRRVDLMDIFSKSRSIAWDVAKHIAGKPTARFWGTGERRITTWTENTWRIRSLPELVEFRADTLAQIEGLDLWKMDIIDMEMIAPLAPPSIRKIAEAVNFNDEA